MKCIKASKVTFAKYLKMLALNAFIQNYHQHFWDALYNLITFSGHGALYNSNPTTWLGQFLA